MYSTSLAYGVQAYKTGRQFQIEQSKFENYPRELSKKSRESRIFKLHNENSRDRSSPCRPVGNQFCSRKRCVRRWRRCLGKTKSTGTCKFRIFLLESSTFPSYRSRNLLHVRTQKVSTKFIWDYSSEAVSSFRKKIHENRFLFYGQDRKINAQQIRLLG